MFTTPKIRLLLPTILATAALQLGGPGLAHAAAGDQHPYRAPAQQVRGAGVQSVAVSGVSKRQAADAPAVTSL